jgi:hypothetical protein
MMLVFSFILALTLLDRPCFCTTAMMAEHLAGPGVSVEAPFYCDFEFDGDVDLADVAHFQNLWRGQCAMPE